MDDDSNTLLLVTSWVTRNYVTALRTCLTIYRERKKERERNIVKVFFHCLLTFYFDIHQAEHLQYYCGTALDGTVIVVPWERAA